jgi:hypothetical protein
MPRREDWKVDAERHVGVRMGKGFLSSRVRTYTHESCQDVDQCCSHIFGSSEDQCSRDVGYIMYLVRYLQTFDPRRM